MMTRGVEVAEGRPRRFDPPNFLWHFGAAVAIVATGWLVAAGFERYGAWTLFAVALAYLLAYAGASVVLLRLGWPTPAGLLATLAVGTVPLAVYAFEKATGLWVETAPGSFDAFHEEVLASWIVMEVVTIAAGLVALSLVRFPLILAPVAFVAWYLSMDLAPVLFGSDVTDDERTGVSIAVGLVLVGLGLALDARAARRYAFWLHLFGLLTLLGSLCWFTFEHNTPLTWAVVTAISVVATLAAVPLARSTFAVFGGLGLVASLSYWSYELFEGSPAFPVAVTAIGLAFIGLGMAWYARAEQWGGAARRRLPRLGSVRRSG